MELFFITGLPRSRTAWFSAFMTASGFPCEHEVINGCESMGEYKEKVRFKSDSNTCFAFVGNPFPDRKTLIIHRGDSPLAEYAGNLDKIKGMHVNFKDIDYKISNIFKYLTGCDIDMAIYEKFKLLNITTMIEINEGAAKRLCNGSNK